MPIDDNFSSCLRQIDKPLVKCNLLNRYQENKLGW